MARDAAPVLAVEGLATGYGHIEALRGVSLTVGPAGSVAIVGPNGAGKTTLLRAISNLLTHRAGSVSFLGRSTRGRKPDELVREGLVHVPEGRGIFRSITVLENLQLGATPVPPKQRSPAALERVYALFPRLRERARQLAGSLSGGEQQMLALGKALMANPRLLLLDEPSHGLAPFLVTEVFRLIGEFKAEGIAVLLIEQNARKALEVADYGYVLSGGKVVLEGPTASLRANDAVVHAYLRAQPPPPG